MTAPAKISGKEYALTDIFSDNFKFHIPVYQRPYAWTESETGDLFNDLYNFYESGTSDNYFLGCIVLIKEENRPGAEIIDGQQRLTTLTIFIAALNNALNILCTEDKKKKSLLKYLQSEEDEVKDIKAEPRIFLRAKDQEFFRKYIQEVNFYGLNHDENSASLDTEAKKHIQDNCNLLCREIKDKFNKDGEELFKFAKFLLTRCYLIVVSTPNQESAFRIFSVLNSRGMDLLPIDIIKSETIGKLPADNQNDYSDKWEELENLTGRDGFNELFTHIRTIFAKERPKKNILEEFRYFVSAKTTPKELIDKYLDPYAKIFNQLKKCEYKSIEYASEINQSLKWLNKTNNYDWMPPAIKFFQEHANDERYLVWFIKKLERLASYLLVTAQDVNRRFNRYRWLLFEMESNSESSMENPLTSIELTEWEKEKFIEALDGKVYELPSWRRNYIMQQLNSFVGDGGVSYTANIFTIEHVLPRNPRKESEWLKLWPDEKQRQHWLNRIANLVPLTRERNSAAQNFDFDIKKEKYFKSQRGTTSYALTTQVCQEKEWTPKILEERQNYLLKEMKEHWDLSVGPEERQLVLFRLTGRGANASGRPLSQNRFQVNKGSRIAHEISEKLQDVYKKLRAELIENNVIINDIFQKDYEFESYSAAASVILGRSSAGTRDWTCLDGRGLSEVGY